MKHEAMTIDGAKFMVHNATPYDNTKIRSVLKYHFKIEYSHYGRPPKNLAQQYLKDFGAKITVTYKGGMTDKIVRSSNFFLRNQ